MTPEPLGFDPELEGLLRELAADPRSQLLRSTRPRTTAGLLERAGPVRSSRVSGPRWHAGWARAISTSSSRWISMNIRSGP